MRGAFWDGVVIEGSSISAAGNALIAGYLFGQGSIGFGVAFAVLMVSAGVLHFVAAGETLRRWR